MFDESIISLFTVWIKLYKKTIFPCYSTFLGCTCRNDITICRKSDNSVQLLHEICLCVCATTTVSWSNREAVEKSHHLAVGGRNSRSFGLAPPFWLLTCLLQYITALSSSKENPNSWLTRTERGHLCSRAGSTGSTVHDLSNVPHLSFHFIALLRWDNAHQSTSM